MQRMEGACKQVMSSTYSESRLGLMVKDERRNVASPSRVYCWNASTRDELEIDLSGPCLQDHAEWRLGRFAYLPESAFADDRRQLSKTCLCSECRSSRGGSERLRWDRSSPGRYAACDALSRLKG